MALVNVFNSAWLAVQEKLRAISILKTVGMTPAQIVTMINTSTAALGLLATALGLPLGWLITKGLLTLLAHYYGFGNIHLNLNPVIGVILFPVVMGVSMIGSIIPARQAAQLTIVAVLRYE
jgi:putative ABC transport system permease protein